MYLGQKVHRKVYIYQFEVNVYQLQLTSTSANGRLCFHAHALQSIVAKTNAPATSS